MAKPLPFYATLNQAPRSPNGNRKAFTPNNSSSTQRADSRAGAGTETNPGEAPGTSTGTSIPYEGIRAGEIIGHRFWRIHHEVELESIATNYIWKPDTIIEGDIERNYGFSGIKGGIYSFRKDSLELAKNIKNFDRESVVMLCQHIGIAYGTISMWGEVVEHESGYRAQFARVKSIEKVWASWPVTIYQSEELKTILKCKYGV